MLINSTAKLYTPKNPIATLLIVHGMAEHQERYIDFAQYLADNGIMVMTFDHLGHGVSAQQNHTLGYMGNPDPKECMITNVMKYAKELKESNADLPHFILGHSMGSFITRCIIQRYPTEFEGAVIMATSSYNPLASSFVPITKALNKFAPKKPNPVFDKILNTVNNLPFYKEHNEDGFNWLNSNPDKVKIYLKDPLCGFHFTNNGFFGLMSLMHEATNNQWWLSVPKSLPLLFVSGEDDPIGQMGKGIPKIVTQLKSQQFSHVSMHQYPQMRHEILFEDKHLLVYRDILTWLKTTIQTADHKKPS